MMLTVELIHYFQGTVTEELRWVELVHRTDIEYCITRIDSCVFLVDIHQFSLLNISCLIMKGWYINKELGRAWINSGGTINTDLIALLVINYQQFTCLCCSPVRSCFKVPMWTNKSAVTVWCNANTCSIEYVTKQSEDWKRKLLGYDSL